MPLSEWPPWKQFPNVPAEQIRVRQGNQEAYWIEWCEFWNPLSNQQKMTYLCGHDIPVDWLEKIKPGGSDDQFSQLIHEVFAEEQQK